MHAIIIVLSYQSYRIDRVTSSLALSWHSFNTFPKEWYSSFVLEKDAATDFLSSMSSVDPDLLRIPLKDWHPTGTVWSFFGSNAESRPMAGKPEHVDQLRPGVITMHSQICGRKLWMLRPNAGAESWDKVMNVPMLSSERIEIACGEGDQLLIDTAAWYHATNIPGGTGFTWSIAQDFSHQNEADKEEGTVQIESVQLRISQQLCQLCLTPTNPPAGSPPGTCGCWCCGQERLKITLWRSFRLSSLLTQRFLKRNLAMQGTNPVHEAMRQFWQRRRLAICDEPKIKEARWIRFVLDVRVFSSTFKNGFLSQHSLALHVETYIYIII